MGGGIGRFKDFFDQYRAIVDHNNLKKEICGKDNRIEPSEEKNVDIHLPEVLPPDPLG
jgi:hypothetical protein